MSVMFTPLLPERHLDLPLGNSRVVGGGADFSPRTRVHHVTQVCQLEHDTCFKLARYPVGPLLGLAGSWGKETGPLSRKVAEGRDGSYFAAAESRAT